MSYGFDQPYFDSPAGVRDFMRERTRVLNEQLKHKPIDPIVIVKDMIKNALINKYARNRRNDINKIKLRYKKLEDNIENDFRCSYDIDQVNNHYDDLINFDLKYYLNNHDKLIEDKPLDLSIPKFSDTLDYSLHTHKVLDKNLRARIIQNISNKINTNIKELNELIANSPESQELISKLQSDIEYYYDTYLKSDENIKHLIDMYGTELESYEDVTEAPFV